MLPSMLSQNARKLTLAELPSISLEAADSLADQFDAHPDFEAGSLQVWHDPTPKDTGRGEAVEKGSLWVFDGHDAWFWDGMDWLPDPDNDDHDSLVDLP